MCSLFNFIWFRGLIFTLWNWTGLAGWCDWFGRCQGTTHIQIVKNIFGRLCYIFGQPTDRVGIESSDSMCQILLIYSSTNYLQSVGKLQSSIQCVTLLAGGRARLQRERSLAGHGEKLHKGPSLFIPCL